MFFPSNFMLLFMAETSRIFHAGLSFIFSPNIQPKLNEFVQTVAKLNDFPAGESIQAGNLLPGLLDRDSGRLSGKILDRGDNGHLRRLGDKRHYQQFQKSIFGFRPQLHALPSLSSGFSASCSRAAVRISSRSPLIDLPWSAAAIFNALCQRTPIRACFVSSCSVFWSVVIFFALD